jgi:hypothetical protein
MGKLFRQKSQRDDLARRRLVGSSKIHEQRLGTHSDAGAGDFPMPKRIQTTP